MRATKAVEKANTKTREELTEVTRKLTLYESGAAIKAQQDATAQSFWAKQGDGFKDFLLPNGSLNLPKIEELRKADPESFNVRIRAAQDLDLEVAEMYKLFNGLTRAALSTCAAPKNQILISCCMLRR